jgi:Cu(I)/Ag(I) efflux system membrane fusion protein
MRTLLYLVLVLAASGVAFVAGRSSRPASGAAGADVAATAPAAGIVYTCSMHPQVRRGKPGRCPICGMPLVEQMASTPGAAEGGARPLQLSEHALAMASIETAPVERRALSRPLRAVGKVQYNESALATVTARVDGYVERLFVNFTGVEIKAGDHLAELYSPSLVVGEQELLLALRDGLSEYVELSKTKLKRWGLTDEQIADLIRDRKVTDSVTLFSPISGTVIEKPVVQSSAFKAGDVLYRVANLDTVWVYLDVYEYDLAWVRYGQRVVLSTEALPGRPFGGVVTFVQPVLDEQSRTVRVPVHVDNPGHALKPGMFVSAVISADLAADGLAAPTGVEGKFSCAMHPQVVRDEPGACPVCGMGLTRIPGAPARAATRPSLPLAVPASAVLDSGTRQIVYVERGRGRFEPREVTLGPRGDEFVPVLSGLEEGERVATRGGFLIDSQFQITGRPSLLYPGGLAAGAGAHRYGGTAPSTAGAQPDGRSEPAAAPQGHRH